jgi:DHA1 family solute carrier family 18 vesicular amine transporter 1/2
VRSSRATAVAVVTCATFTDILAYSIAVPVLPDLSRRLGASPTMIGLLFASFGVTLLTVSIPMGAASDRMGRKAPLVLGMLALAASTTLFAFGHSLPSLFVARLVQGAADAITWVVGFALIADLYGPAERGRVTGIVMSGTGFSFMIGPSIGGWLYELGGARMPFIAVAILALLVAAGFMLLCVPDRHAAREIVPVTAVVRTPEIAACATAVITASATTSMFEPVLALHLTTMHVGPARIGIVFGIAAVVTTTLHPVFGRMADRWGARRLTLLGLMLSAPGIVLLGQTWSFESTIVLYVIGAVTIALVITPSLAYMAEATSSAGIGSFGVAYGLYNMAWGAGLLGGPAIGGFLYERVGFTALTLVWAPLPIAVSWLLGRIGQVGRLGQVGRVGQVGEGVWWGGGGWGGRPAPPAPPDSPDLPGLHDPAIFSIRFHSTSVTGITDRREILTSGKSVNAASALISASVTARGSRPAGATSTTACLPVLSPGSGYASPSAFAMPTTAFSSPV